MQDVVITGVGLVSDSDSDVATARARTADPGPEASRGGEFIAFPVADEIPNHADQRAMGPTMLAAVFAAGKALQQAGLKGAGDLLSTVQIITAGRCTERDESLDEDLRAEVTSNGLTVEAVNHGLRNRLRPTFYLTQLPNLISANISIVHGITGRSQTFLGEEPASIAAVATAYERIAFGETEICLVGGVCRANGGAFSDSIAAYPEGSAAGAGTAAAYLVLEAASSASKRGQRPLAKIASVWRDSLDRAAADYASQIADAVAKAIRGGDDAPTRAYSSTGYGTSPENLEKAVWRAVESRMGNSVQTRRLNPALGALFEASVPAALALAASSNEDGTLGSQRSIIVNLGTLLGESVIVLEAYQ